MTTTTYQTTSKVELPHFEEEVCASFRKAASFFFWLHFNFIFLIALEILFFFIFLPFLQQSYWIAFAVAVLFLTCFTYYVLSIYYRSVKGSDFLKIRDEFLKKSLDSIGDDPLLHSRVAGNAIRVSETLKGMEYNFFKAPRWISFFDGIIEKLSLWAFSHDVFVIRSEFLHLAIFQYIEQIITDPMDLEGHQEIANAYVMLYSLLTENGQIEEGRRYCRRAIEEFKILCQYAPHDPWVHTQLAYGYHDLQMPKDEIREYEILLKLCPYDRQVLYDLGVLYFEQGMNAQGLKIYDDLKRVNLQKAEALIQHYGLIDDQEK